MPDKDFEELKKQVAKELKLHGQKTEADCKKAKPLREEEAELCKKKEPSDDDKARAVDLRKALQGLEKSYLTQMDSASDRLTRLLKNTVPDDKKVVPEWQKGMDKWYRDTIDKEAGLDLGNDLRLTGEISIKDKKAMLILKGKF